MQASKRSPATLDLETLFRASHLIEPSAGTLRRALVLGSALTKPRSVVDWLVQVLFDSALQPVPVGVRKGSSVSERRLLFGVRPSGAEDAEQQVDVRIRREPKGTIEVAGQILPPASAVRVEVVLGRTRRKVDVGSAGEFLLRDLKVTTEKLELQVHLSDGGMFKVAAPLPPSSEIRTGR